MTEFVAKTFRERPDSKGVETETLYSAEGARVVTMQPPAVEVVGRIHKNALMGPTNAPGNVVIELWSNGTVTWRDG